MTALLEVEGLRKSFGGIAAVDGVDLTLERGEVRALIGPNGAGKTTFFNLLTGHLAPDTGTVRFRGERLDGLAPHRIWRRGVARTFQIPAVFANLTVVGGDLSILHNGQLGSLNGLEGILAFDAQPQLTARGLLSHGDGLQQRLA